MLRLSRHFGRIATSAVRYQASAAPAADGAPENIAPHITEIVNRIGSLTILEVSQLRKISSNISLMKFHTREATWIFFELQKKKLPDA